jgi:hypothetical protein
MRQFYPVRAIFTIAMGCLVVSFWLVIATTIVAFIR